MNAKLQNLKTKTKTHVPHIVAGVSLGTLAAATLWYRYAYPNDKVVVKLPKGAMETMRNEGKGLALNTNEGWFTLHYVPND